jgi:hypothetical protein
MAAARTFPSDDNTLNGGSGGDDDDDDILCSAVCNFRHN